MGKKIKKEIELVLQKQEYCSITERVTRTYTYKQETTRLRDVYLGEIVKATVEANPYYIDDFIELYGVDKVCQVLKENL